MFNVTTETVFFWRLDLACNALYFNKPYNRIAHITFYTQSKRLLLTIIRCSLYTTKELRPSEVCSLDGPWSFTASHCLMHYINRCTWISSQYCIIIIMMAFSRVSEKLVFHQSKCISAVKRIHSTTAMYVSSSFFMYLCIPCYGDACLKSSALRVGVKTLHNTIQWVDA